MMNDAQLDLALKSVAAEIDYPPTPDLAARVRRQITSAPLPRRTRWQRWQPALVTAAVLALAFTGVLVLSPGAREAVADLLGIDSVRIEFDERAPVPTATSELGLGSPMSLAAAEQKVGFEVKVPDLAELGEPEVYVTSPPEPGMVSLFYPDAYPRASEPGLLITQFRANLDGAFFKKLALDEATVEYLTLEGEDAYWVEGTHYFYYFDADEDLEREDVRIAQNVLLWDEDGVAYRIEGNIEKAEAMRIAGSLPD